MSPLLHTENISPSSYEAGTLTSERQQRASEKIRERVLMQRRGKYDGLSDQHFTGDIFT